MDSEKKIHDEYSLRILLSPLSYFHSDYCEFPYKDIPMHLQAAYNTFMIKQFNLELPSNHTAALPHLLLQKWWKLPEITFFLGAISLPDRHLWWLRKYVNRNSTIPYGLLESNSIRQLAFIPNSPAQVSAIGLARLLFIMTPFGDIYTKRLKYMFSKQIISYVNLLTCIPTSWSLFCEVCQYEED